MHPNPAGVLVDFEKLVEYWLDETGTADTERIDMHLLACAAVCP